MTTHEEMDSLNLTFLPSITAKYFPDAKTYHWGTNDFTEVFCTHIVTDMGQFDLRLAINQ